MGFGGKMTIRQIVLTEMLENFVESQKFCQMDSHAGGN